MPQHLQPPGAGLPFLEGLVAKYVFYPSNMRRFDWMQSLARFGEETEKIVCLAAPLTPEQFRTPVLIDRLTGMEDSSRFWSVGMTIEHLMITIPAMTRAAATLAAGQKLEMKVGTADVKPKGEIVPDPAALLALVDESCRTLAPFAQTVSDRYKVRHPWFGPIPARGWVFVLAEHQKLHRVQVERIVRGLPNTP